MIPISLHLTAGMRAMLGILMVISCGAAALLLRAVRKSWPRQFDANGIIVADGRRFDWNALDAVRPLNVLVHGMLVGRRIDLIFGEVTVRVFPESLREGRKALAFIERRLDTKLVF